MEQVPIEILRGVPPVTKTWLLGILFTSLLDYCGFVDAADLLYSSKAVFSEHEYWRLVTCFLYFRPLSIDLIFSLFFVLRTSSSLEESFGFEWINKIDYLWTIIVNGIMILIVCTFIKPQLLLGPLLDEALVYLWSRRNDGVDMALFGLIRLNASYLPFFSVLMKGLVGQRGFKESTESALLTLIVSHIFFFLSDIFPQLHGYQPLFPWHN